MLASRGEIIISKLCKLNMKSKPVFTNLLHTTANNSIVCGQTRRRLQRELENNKKNNLLKTGQFTNQDSAYKILQHSSLRVTRQLEMMNVFIGYEQANRYTLVDPNGNPTGFMVEERTLLSEIGRQIYRLHRPFKVLVLDLDGKVCLRIRRPFSLINSRISVTEEHSKRIIGESQQEWHPWRRRYNLFLRNESPDNNEYHQFARVDAPFLSWDFPMCNEQGAMVAGVFRDFAGIGMELFSDYGLYAVCFDQIALSQRYAASSGNGALTAEQAVTTGSDLDLDQRAVVLAAAVSIDFDYFSRHSHGGMGGLGMMFFPMSSSNDQF
ncbi:Scramblase-domain-containing protein, partial [Coemansia reversa NRRL 1564]